MNCGKFPSGNPVKSNFRFRFSRNQNKKLKFRFRIDRNRKEKINIPVPVIRTGIVFGQIRYLVPVLKTPFRSYPRLDIDGVLVHSPWALMGALLIA